MGKKIICSELRGELIASFLSYTTKARTSRANVSLFIWRVYDLVVSAFFFSLQTVFLFSLSISSCPFFEVNTKMPIEQPRYIQVCFPFFCVCSVCFFSPAFLIQTFRCRAAVAVEVAVANSFNLPKYPKYVCFCALHKPTVF